jgi:hypothetical protein
MKSKLNKRKRKKVICLKVSTTQTKAAVESLSNEDYSEDGSPPRDGKIK